MSIYGETLKTSEDRLLHILNQLICISSTSYINIISFRMLIIGIYLTILIFHLETIDFFYGFRTSPTSSLRGSISASSINWYSCMLQNNKLTSSFLTLTTITFNMFQRKSINSQMWREQDVRSKCWDELLPWDSQHSESDNDRCVHKP